MSGDRPKKPAGWYGKEQRAARAAAAAGRKENAQSRRQEADAERTRREAELEPYRSAARVRMAKVPTPPAIDPALLRPARVQSRKERQKAILQRQPDVIDVSKPHPPVAPTPEQAARANFVEEDVLEKDANGVGIKIGHAYSRRARYDTVQGLSVLDRRALARYRAAFDKGAISETKSALDIRPRGAGGIEAALSRLEKIIDARWEVSAIEALISPALLPTLRAVALYDRDFKAVAIERFGGRDVSRIDVTRKRPAEVVTIEPISGRHRERIRREFLEGTAQLVAVITAIDAADNVVTAAAADMTQLEQDLGIAEALPGPSDPNPKRARIDPAFLDSEGRMRPFAEVREIILERWRAEAA